MSFPLPRRLKVVLKDALVALAFARAHGFIASYPKSGRTWLRFILANYLSDVFRLGLTIDLHSLFQVIPNDRLDAERGRRAFRFGDRPEVPLLVASHSPYRKALFRSKKILFMLREPKDVMVSAYFHRAKHGGGYLGGLKAFLRDPEHGLAKYLQHTNSWAENLGGCPHLLVSYEQLSADTRSRCRAALAFFDLPIDEAALGRAIAASSFDAMQAVELERGIVAHRYDRRDPDGRRVRRGKVAGYSDYLDAEDIAFIDEGCRRGLDTAARDLLTRVGIDLERVTSGAAKLGREVLDRSGRERGPGSDAEALVGEPGQQQVEKRE